MTSAIRAQREAESGFTLIELLVVVIIIGILAAIAIPAFLNQRERAWESELTSTVRNVALEVEAEATTVGGQYDDIDLNGAAAPAAGAASVVQLITNELIALQGEDPAAAGTPNGPVVFAGAASLEVTSTAFGFCMTHEQLNDGAAAPVAAASLSYLSNAGGLADIDDNGCNAAEFDVTP